MEFLPDELVQVDEDEFLADEFVFDDAAAESDVGFAGPSDAPPPRGSSLAPAPAGEPARAARGLARGAGRLRTVRVGWAAAAMVAGFGLFGTVRLARMSTVAAQPPSSAAPTQAEPRSEDPPRPEPEQPPPATETNVAPDPSTGEASKAPALKREAQEALEHSKVSLAIEVGQRAVDADPTDAETWLILGAAYIQRGRYREARACFKSCVDQATDGPRGECKALLR